MPLRQQIFLSAPSVRRATAKGLEQLLQTVQFLSTPSARRATPVQPRRMVGRIFLSTPSARRATVSAARQANSFTYFYPRPPRGGRRHRNRRWRCGSNFYPRPPRGGRPIEFQIGGESVNISIHALREEGDVQLGAFVLLDHLFLSTPSARRATFRAARFQQGEVHFYPHPP